MSAPSPGPWKLVVPSWDHRPSLHVHDAEGRLVVSLMPWAGEPVEANGRLIAAAWEMRALLRSMVAKRSAALAEYPEIVPLLASIDGPP